MSVVTSCNMGLSDDTKKNNVDHKESLRIYHTNNFGNLNNNTQVQQIFLSNTDWISEFYDKIDFSLVWLNDSLALNKNAEEFLSLLNKTFNYGLDTSLYHGKIILNLKDSLNLIKEIEKKYSLASNIEILLTNSYFLLGKDLNYGIVPTDSTRLVTSIPRKIFNLNLVELLLNTYKSKNITSSLLTVQPDNPEYVKLQKQLENYLKTASLSIEKVQVQPFRLDSVNAYQQSKEALIHHQYLGKDSNDSLYFEALKLFQIQHGLKSDGLVGMQTAIALSQSPYGDYLKAIMSLEKWRWKDQWENKFIYVNIPAYQLKVYDERNLKKAFKVVLGAPTTKTPEIYAEMEYMICYPFWNVPYSISSKELLPKIINDSSYLSRNNYKVFTKDRKLISSQEINWSMVSATNFKYAIRQDGGTDNSLGLIKFVFPNPYSIYFHDTPSKRFFNEDLRALSHGCIRIQNPFELAQLILANDSNKYNLDSVMVFVNKKTERKITLNKKIPIHIEYFTCGTDSNNNIVFYKDIYGYDKKLEELMFLNSYSKPVKNPLLVNN